MSRSVIPRHGKEMHRCNGEDPIPVLWHVKVFPDDEVVTTGDGKRSIVITDDLGGTYVRTANATVTTVGSSATIVQIHKLSIFTDILTDRIQIDSGDTASYDSTSPSSVLEFASQVLRGDVLRIDVDSAGAGAMGLEVLIEFGPALISLTP